MYSGDRQVGDIFLNSKSPMSITAKILVGATTPLWISFGIAGLIIGGPALGAIAVKKRVDGIKKLENYQYQPYDTLAKRSKKFLHSIIEKAPGLYAGKQMEKTKAILSKYTNSLPRVIDADWKMVSQLNDETRDQGEVLRRCSPIQKRSFESLEMLASLGVRLYPATVDACDLDWKEDVDSFIGEGEFSSVYRGTLTTSASNTTKQSNPHQNVAVKLFKQPFDQPNSRFYLNEEIIIRELNHKNVLTFYGSMRMMSTYNPSTPSVDHKLFVFVMESCQANLRSVIFNDDSVTPAKAENTKRAIESFLKWAIGIADGLHYIHQRRLFHRHLKLENILVHKDGRAMISDIGIVGHYKKTEKSIIYLAPEVLIDPKMRTKEADIYSYGIMLWEMWYGTQAFKELMPLNKDAFQERIAMGYHPPTDSRRIIFPEVLYFMKRCWAPDADKRPTALECSMSFLDISLTLNNESFDKSNIHAQNPNTDIN